MNDEAPAADVRAPGNYINRELSFLEFNERVLEQARDTATPLLERVRFLAISCSNLDEFFEIRVSGLKQRLEAGSVSAGADGLAVRIAIPYAVARVQPVVERMVRACSRSGNVRSSMYCDGTCTASANCAAERFTSRRRRRSSPPSVRACFGRGDDVMRTPQMVRGGGGIRQLPQM